MFLPSLVLSISHGTVRPGKKGVSTMPKPNMDMEDQRVLVQQLFDEGLTRQEAMREAGLTNKQMSSVSHSLGLSGETTSSSIEKSRKNRRRSPRRRSTVMCVRHGKDARMRRLPWFRGPRSLSIRRRKIFPALPRLSFQARHSPGSVKAGSRRSTLKLWNNCTETNRSV